MAGVAALERGDTENRLHFQMVCRARTKSALSFGIVVHKYMGRYGKDMDPACKVVTNKQLHTFHVMVGYCLKDTGTEHFDVALHNISDDDIIEGKMLHAIYGCSDLKKRVILTNKNITDRMYV